MANKIKTSETITGLGVEREDSADYEGVAEGRGMEEAYSAKTMICAILPKGGESCGRITKKP